MSYPWDNPQQAAQSAQAHAVAEMQRRYDLGLQQAIHQVRSEFDAKLNRTAGGLRKASAEEIQRYGASVDQRLSDLAKVAEALTATSSGRSDSGNIYIEDIPGRRIPFIYLVEIPIQSGDMSQREGTITVSQEGPFVAERRWATFLSAYEYQLVDEESGAVAKFPGRSNGRYRPVHSSSDYTDSQHNSLGDTVAWVGATPGPGTMPAGVLALPSNSSSFRTMQFDGVIHLEDAGSNWPRQNRPAPSSFWASETNGPVPWSALDFFERGSVITLKVKPNHVSNPPAGNVSGASVFANSAGIDGYPYVQGQYDVHEGIATPEAVAREEDDVWTPTETDPIQRLPDGYLILALEGYRIGQPTGPVL